MVMLHIKYKRIMIAATRYQIFGLQTPTPRSTSAYPENGSIGQNSTFSEHGHGVYQIKENHKCSNMVSNILPAYPSLTLGMGSIGQNSTFLEHGHVAYQSKWNQEIQQYGSKYFARRPPPTHPPDQGDGVNR